MHQFHKIEIRHARPDEQKYKVGSAISIKYQRKQQQHHISPFLWTYEIKHQKYWQKIYQKYIATENHFREIVGTFIFANLIFLQIK